MAMDGPGFLKVNVAMLSSWFTLVRDVSRPSILVTQIKESGIGMAFSTFAVNVIDCEEFTIFDVLPSMDSVISEAYT